MTSILLRLGLFSVLLIVPCLSSAESVVHHQIDVKLTPSSGLLQVRDTITLPTHETSINFSLNAGLTLKDDNSDVHIDTVVKTQPSPGIKLYHATLPSDRSSFTLDYKGSLITLPGGFPTASQENQSYISADDVYLDGSSNWYPQFDNELVTFSVEVELPPSWHVISQGLSHTGENEHRQKRHWEEVHPQEEIYLLAAAYHEYDGPPSDISASVYLREADPTLADQYIPAILKYVKMYSHMLGPYPYDKFAVVENTWDSGYGMPSFTLLGPRVMRFPFILHTSLPHEILHNWWGNGVYVDYSKGNWSEGLTAYLADHLMRERIGKGVSYRRNALLRYTNYVSAGNDFPLKQFQGRHNEATQAVGYDKALMVFHMIRMQLGDRDFLEALRQFYREKRFHIASWYDLRHTFETVAGYSLKKEFNQWLNRRGAPSLHLVDSRTRREGDHYEMDVKLLQDQEGPPYRLHIPLAVALDARKQAWQTIVDMTQKKQTFHLSVPTRPWRLEVDPQFDVFRRLDPGELPPSLSEALGAKSLLIILPSKASPPLRKAYTSFAQAWAEGDSAIEIKWDKDISKLPPGRAVLLMGWENRFLSQLAEDLQTQISLTRSKAVFGERTFNRDNKSVVLTAHHGIGNTRSVLMWLGCDNPAAIPGLARKLPHYGSYSYLAFDGNAPTNVLKGQWNVVDSPLNAMVTQADQAAPPANVEVHLRPRVALGSD